MALQPPGGVSYTVNSLNQVVLTWYSVAGAISYNIYKRSDALGFVGSPINSVPITSLNYTDLQFDGTTENYYSVTAVDIAGVESLPSISSYIPYQTANSPFVMPRVDLWNTAFDKFVVERGYNVIWEKAINCPCNRSTKETTDATDLNCPLCKNKHFIWVNPTQIKCMMTSLGRDNDLAQDGIYQIGSYKVTTHSSHKIGFYDRLTFTETSAPLTESVTKGVAGGADSLRFPAFLIQLPIIDIDGLYYTNGPDFTLNASGQVVWNGPSSRQPSTGKAYGINYLTQWRMLSTEYSHDIRATHVQLGTSSPIFVELARQCICRLEWFFDI